MVTIGLVVDYSSLTGKDEFLWGMLSQVSPIQFHLSYNPVRLETFSYSFFSFCRRIHTQMHADVCIGFSSHGVNDVRVQPGLMIWF